MATEAQILVTDRVADKATKRCANCGKWKASDQFGPNPRAGDGKKYWCRQCYRFAEYARYHDGGGKERKAAAADEVRRARNRAWKACHREQRYATMATYRKTPRGKLIMYRCNARSKLRRAATDEQRSRLAARIALCDRELARLDAEHELPAKRTPPRVRKGGKSPCRGVYVTPAGTFEVRVSVGKSRSVRGGTFATLDEATAAANALAFRLKGIVGYAVAREEQRA